MWLLLEIASSKCSAESVPGRIICGSHHLCWLLAGRNIPTMRNKAAPRGSFYPPPPPSPHINMQPVQLTWRQPSSVCRWAAGTHRGAQAAGRGNKDRAPTTVLISPATISQFTTAGAGSGWALLPLKLSDTLRVGTLRRGQSGGLIELQMKVHTKVRNHGEGPYYRTFSYS